MQGEVGDAPRLNKHKLLISDQGLFAINKALLENPFQTRTKIKTDLIIIASSRVVGEAIRRPGWRHVRTKYYQIAEPQNRV